MSGEGLSWEHDMLIRGNCRAFIRDEPSDSISNIDSHFMNITDGGTISSRAHFYETRRVVRMDIAGDRWLEFDLRSLTTRFPSPG